MSADKFYITTSIAYTNAPPHIGFALELVQADVLARYFRLRGKEVYFLTGTDEHGTKIEKAAKEAGLSPKEFTDKISSKFKELTQIFNISNTDFIRTTDTKRHVPAVQKVWQILKANGDIYKKTYQGLYCPGCEAFLTKKDLVDGKCPNHQIEPQVIEEENYFFRLSKFQKQIKEIIRSGQIKIIPEERKNEILSFIEKGLEDISFSRSKDKLQWGIEVPDDPSQVIYVWCDALTNYISALGYATESETFKKFWPADIHLIGKDILRFHAVYWPAMLLSLNLPLPNTILVHGFITVEGQKMSKSLGNVIDPFKLVEKYGTDATRYFLLREIPTTKDGDFSYSKFEKRYNDDLAKGLGNLVARIIGISSKISLDEFQTPEKDKMLSSQFRGKVQEAKENYQIAMENYRFNEALIAVWDLISYCDKYIEANRLWEETHKKISDIKNMLIALEEIAYLLKPFLPSTSKKIFQRISLKISQPLFPRI